MTGQDSTTIGARAGRALHKVARRAVGFVLLCITIGLTTCATLDTVKSDAASRAAVHGVLS